MLKILTLICPLVWSPISSYFFSLCLMIRSSSHANPRWENTSLFVFFCFRLIGQCVGELWLEIETDSNRRLFLLLSSSGFVFISWRYNGASYITILSYIHVNSVIFFFAYACYSHNVLLSLYQLCLLAFFVHFSHGLFYFCLSHVWPLQGHPPYDHFVSSLWHIKEKTKVIGFIRIKILTCWLGLRFVSDTGSATFYLEEISQKIIH